MKILSLFDGISCARVAIERAGIPVEAYYASEIDKYAMQISVKNYPDIIQVGSVVGLDTTQFNNIGLLVGGSPCQDLSIAKKDRKGLSGDRSGLFWEYVRILKEVKPKYFVLENVNSMPKEAKALITETLGVEPIMIDAALVSAQRRKRLFWTNIPNVGLPEDRGILLKDILENIETTETLNKEIKGRIAGWSENEDTILAFNSDKKRSTIAEKVYHKPHSKSNAITIANVPKLVLKEKSNTVRTGGSGSGAGDKHDWESVYRLPVALRNRGEGKKPEYNGTGKANAMTTVQTDSMVDMPPIRKLTPTECERLQSLPDGYTEGVSNTQRYKALGNAFNVEVVAHILSSIPTPLT